MRDSRDVLCRRNNEQLTIRLRAGLAVDVATLAGQQLSHVVLVSEDRFSEDNEPEYCR